MDGCGQSDVSEGEKVKQLQPLIAESVQRCSYETKRHLSEAAEQRELVSSVTREKRTNSTSLREKCESE